MGLLTAGGKRYLNADTPVWTKNGSDAMGKVAAGQYIMVPGAASSDERQHDGQAAEPDLPIRDGHLSTNGVKTEVNGVPPTC
jgi:hypothetical protein